MPVASVAAATCLAAAFASILMGCVLISGVAFLLLTLASVRQLIVAVIPPHLLSAVAGGNGLFIGFIGLKNAGIIVADPATFVALGNLEAPGAELALFGLLTIAVLSVWNVRGAMLVGIVATTFVGWLFGEVSMKPEPYTLSA